MANIHKDKNNLLPMGTWRLSRAAILVLVVVVSLQPVIADTSFEGAVLLAQKGDLSYSAGMYAEALAAYTASVEQDPYNSIVWNKLGMTQDQLGNYAGAVDSFDHAIKLDPYFGNAWVNKGDALRNLGKTGDAIEVYDRAIAINPNDLRALVNRGENLQDLGKQEEAQKVFNEVIRISDKEIRSHPNDAKYDAGLWSYRAMAFTKLGRYREALQSYDQALTIDPKHIDALKNKQALLRTLDSIGNVSLPQPVPTTGTAGLRPTKKPAPLMPYVPALGVIVLAVWFGYVKRRHP
jgi:tetratricopeptide (TPR) repeat protein